MSRTCILQHAAVCWVTTIHDLLVMLLEQDIPTNNEEKMVDLNARNDLEL
jgi:hypothetical protein